MAKSITTIEDLFARTVLTNTGCRLWTRYKNRQGYGQTQYLGKLWLAHRLAWELARGPIPDGICALHRCDTPLCVNPDHLFVGTKADNVADMRSKGRGNDPRGEANGRAKLSDADVLKIRRLAGLLSLRKTAALFGVGPTSIRSVLSGRTWRHVA